ncbi:hypothetical protein ACSNOI_34370 [Actinomadura kijaniata]|uniref:hypothetical protein n=1 Tax=Actinomadura kijaniata TaxID=46161 RepID=UPI003F1AD4E1
MATLFHVWTNPRSAALLQDPTWTGGIHAGLALAALALLARPGSARLLLVLCGLQVVAALFELPFLGNHWLLVALVAAGLLLSAAAVRVSSGTMDADELNRRFLPVARTTLVVAYGFAAFSKLNEGFFEPSRSCATFFGDELLTGWGLPGPPGTGPVAWTMMVGSAAVECSVPILLLHHRTRHVGVLLALLFHGVIALDVKHFFIDFSSVLLALFLLFLPASYATWLRGHARRLRYSPRLPLLGSAALSVGMWVLPHAQHLGLAVLGLFALMIWVMYDAVIVFSVIAYLRARPAPERLGSGAAPRWLLVVPVLAALNGLTPYLELKTGFGWNMYSNLVTVGGHSNHLLVRRTLPLSDEQRHLVTVLDSSDPDLREYATERYRLTVLSLRDYARRHPDVRLRYELDGVVHDTRVGDDPLLSRPVPPWRSKLQLFRAVDADPQPRCLDRWGAAR